VNKAAKIGIGIAIIVGIIGIYAVSTIQEPGQPSGELDIEDTVGIEIVEEEKSVKVPTEGEEFKLKDEAEVEVEEPEEEEREVIEVFAEEKFPLDDKLP